jgi:hypothetical protein
VRIAGRLAQRLSRLSCIVLHTHEEFAMSNAMQREGRRRFIQLAVSGVVAAPFALATGPARAVDTVTESDPTATALGYKVDAAKAAGRTDKSATCATCNFYSGKAGAADGPCSVFGGRLVSAKGWCSAYAKKG